MYYNLIMEIFTINQYKNTDKTSGFTIIEVMIVLAIAALILLIVFLAVPALERNSRNLQRKNDASAIANGIASFIADNAGEDPISLSRSSNILIISPCYQEDDINDCSIPNPVQEDVKLGFYNPVNVTIEDVPSDMENNADNVIIDVGYGCNSTDTQATPGPYQHQTDSVLYALENNGGHSSECIDQ